jgi:hypothetical protein
MGQPTMSQNHDRKLPTKKFNTDLHQYLPCQQSTDYIPSPITPLQTNQITPINKKRWSRHIHPHLPKTLPRNMALSIHQNIENTHLAINNESISNHQKLV